MTDYTNSQHLGHLEDAYSYLAYALKSIKDTEIARATNRSKAVISQMKKRYPDQYQYMKFGYMATHLPSDLLIE